MAVSLLFLVAYTVRPDPRAPAHSRGTVDDKGLSYQIALLAPGHGFVVRLIPLFNTGIRRGKRAGLETLSA